MQRATIKDIAKKLGVSASTVSRALSDHPDISPSTKSLVKSTAKEMHYFPNSIAQSLKTKNTKTIGVIIPEIKHAFFSSAISGIEAIAYNSGYTILVCQSNESYEREKINTASLESQRIAGLLTSISQETTNCDHFLTLQKRGLPIVFFDRVCEEFNATKVIIDDEQSAYTAVKYLLDKGYSNIAHLAGPSVLKICKGRLNGYKKALSERNIAINEDMIINAGLHEGDGYNSFSKLIERGMKPDAIFAVNDPVAVGAFKKIRELGLKIPQDVALVGFSNNPITSLIEPGITTVDQPSFDMGQKAAELLIKQIENGDDFVPVTEVLQTHLIIRNST